MTVKDSSTKPELMPCPFCGCEAFTGKAHNLYYIKADHSGACFMADDGAAMYYFRHSENLIEKWNTRS